MDRMGRMDTLEAKLANAPGSDILTKVKHSTTAMAGFFPSFVRGLVFSRFSKDENPECEKSILVFRLLDHVCRTCMAPTTSAGGGAVTRQWASATHLLFHGHVGFRSIHT